MAKVYGMHELELKPGVDGQEFETYFTRELSPLFRQISGQTIHLVKGDRGSREGRYLLLFEIDSVERRDSLYPVSGGESPEMDRMFADNSAIVNKANDFVVAIPDPKFTDYVTVE